MDLLRDVRLSLRHLRHSPGYALAAVVTLALAIGANSAIFSAVRAVLLDPLPVRAPGDLVICWETDRALTKGVSELSYQNFRDWARHTRSFSHTAAVGSSTWPAVLDGRGEPVRVASAGVSASFFETLGVRPFLGRLLHADDDLPNAARVTVVRYETWVTRFAADRGAIGTQIRLNDKPHTVVGVLPPEFDVPRGTEFWTPVVPILAASTQDWNANALTSVGVLFVIGRLHDGVTPAMAQVELDALAARLHRETGAPRFGATVVVTPLLDHLHGPVRSALWSLFAAVGVLLLIACANVSGLMLTRVSLRRREHAIRLALGASRLGLGRLWAIETGIIAVAGGVLGLVASRWIAAAIIALAPDDVPRLANAAIDLPVALFTCAVVIAVALLCGLTPVRHAGALHLVDALKDAARGTTGVRSQRARSLLLVVQIGLAVVLLIAAGLVVRSLVLLRQLDLGFVPDRVLTLSVVPRGAPSGTALVDELLERVRAMPGVQAAGAVYIRPMRLGSIGHGTWVLLDGQPHGEASTRQNPVLNYQCATPGYFTAMNIAIVRGRDFTMDDREDAPPVAIVSEGTARRLWPGQDPIGKRMYMPTMRKEEPKVAWRTVVGVVRDVRYRGLDDDTLDVYDPSHQSGLMAWDLTVRTSADPIALVSVIQAEARRIYPAVLIDGVTTLDAVVGRAVAPWRFSVWLFTLFAALAFLLAMVGLFSVVSLDVVQRSREFAVRLTLGAQRRDILRRVLLSAALRVFAGLALGVGVAAGVTRWMRSLLFGIEPLDAVTYGAVVALVLAIVFLASLLPARRAAGIDPLILLRRE